VTEVLEAENVEDETPVTLADSDAGLPVALALGMGMVEMGASDVRDVTPYRAAQSVRLMPLGQHHVPSALSVQ